MTSETLAVALWPLAQPTWAVGLLNGGHTARPPAATRWANAAAGYLGERAPAWWARYGEWLVAVPLFLLYSGLLMLAEWGALEAETRRLTRAMSPPSSPLPMGGNGTHAM